MLKTLHIENYALIRETDISFAGGFVVITGETGAGKSILLGALGLLLGQRADTQVLSDKEHKCVVEATFDIADLGLEPLFARYDADYDDVLILVSLKGRLPEHPTYVEYKGRLTYSFVRFEKQTMLDIENSLKKIEEIKMEA